MNNDEVLLKTPLWELRELFMLFSQDVVCHFGRHGFSLVKIEELKVGVIIYVVYILHSSTWTSINHSPLFLPPVNAANRKGGYCHCYIFFLFISHCTSLLHSQYAV